MIYIIYNYIIHDLFMPIWSHFFKISVVIQPNLQRAISPIIRSEVAKATDPTFFDPTVSLGKRKL